MVVLEIDEFKIKDKLDMSDKKESVVDETVLIQEIIWVISQKG